MAQFGGLEVSQKTRKYLGGDSGEKVATKAILWQIGDWRFPQQSL